MVLKTFASPEWRLDKPIHTERPVRVICIGAGASGLQLAYKLQKHISNFSLTVYEKNPEVSGTWYENKYPGCACDVPSHNYTYSFEPKTDWSGLYGTGQEIFTYFNDFADKYGLRRYIKTQHQVVGAKWTGSGWKVTIKNLITGEIVNDTCDILVNAAGFLNNWKWPDIPGLDKYKGALLHSANWDETVDLKGKTVGLIGNGSSGIQILPAIQPIAQKVIHFMRNANWVAALPGGEGRQYSEEEKRRFAEEPGHLLAYRRRVERGNNALLPVFIKGSDANKKLGEYMFNTMKEKLAGNKELEEKLIPNWAVGCRRLTPGPGYLEAFAEPNVQVVFSGVTEVTERGCKCEDGTQYDVPDVLICATGFDVSYRPRFPIVAGDKNLQDVWAEDPESYLGLAVADFPNYFMIFGPNCPIGNGPLLPGVEAQTDYMVKMIDHWQTHNIRTFTPDAAAVRDFIAYRDQFMPKTVWADACKAWYKSNGKVTALWCGSTLHYLEAIRQIRFEDWKFEYEGNRFTYLGNGQSQTETNPDADHAYYIRNEDDDLPLARNKMTNIINKTSVAVVAENSGEGVFFSGI
ncbi:hypothetical protein B0T20DRAFT_500411 [Sordaria brevicollis]|uniref:FAD/NAD(P)-binding domain-containing protein n=1 Tax=Sordaria brevicollis TaxID=83679 RepID=A0AAE0PBG7_SORBR|nr:hypothetical protein B0T20DRAFT_500411 [Sordaria brevicollis]